MYHPWDDDKGASRVDGGERSEVVYCSPVMTKQMASSLPPRLRRKEALGQRKRHEQERGEPDLSRPRILDEVPPLSVQDKTHFRAGGRTPSDFITREHTLPEVPLWHSFVYEMPGP